MNLVSTLVGITIMGAAAPSVLNMTMAPMIAQKRADNFGLAEAAAVTFAAYYEGGTESPVATDNCTTENLGSLSWSVTCNEGTGQFRQEVSRSFRLAPENLSYTNPTRSFAFDTPKAYSHVECLPGDPWGVIWYNDHLKAGNLEACIPQPVWSAQNYRDSNPDDWLYDLSGYGFGRHPDF